MMRSTKFLGFATFAFALIWSVQVIVLALSVKEWLDDETLIQGGGWPYAVCFLVAGLSVSAVALYSWFLEVAGWSRMKMLKAIRAAFGISLVAAIGCTVWFVAYTGYFNPTGLLGLAVAVTGAGWAISLCSIELQREGAS